jgi:hypothetical protein
MVTIIKKGTPKSEIRKQVNKVVSKNKKTDIRKYAGILTIDIDPIVYQKNMRNEWE